eukprot:TRINITY_DN109257_c0_g1_i1.p1 TRINITY_DN109257_c0_g1~~TRINITY_DN109257_c0_g1_i1.p1  ORF type:complete len:326 (+),score=6.92 TRINITY_DN109257_c0_g1_i1:49-978(+)
MGAETSKQSIQPTWRPLGLPAHQMHPQANVTLHVYDLDASSELQFLNGFLRPLGTGAFHTGIEVFDKEWSYRGGNREGTGVFSCVPSCCSGLRPRESVHLGKTSLASGEVHRLIKHLEIEWPSRAYDITRRNCTHFSDELCKYLGVGPIPDWAKSLAGAGSRLVEMGGLIAGVAGNIASAFTPSDEPIRINRTSSVSYLPPPDIRRSQTVDATMRAPAGDLRRSATAHPGVLRSPAPPGRPHSPPPRMLDPSGQAVGGRIVMLGPHSLPGPGPQSLPGPRPLSLPCPGPQSLPGPLPTTRTRTTWFPLA